jgi:hypothetical protein
MLKFRFISVIIQYLFLVIIKNYYKIIINILYKKYKYVNIKSITKRSYKYYIGIRW